MKWSVETNLIKQCPGGSIPLRDGMVISASFSETIPNPNCPTIMHHLISSSSECTLANSSNTLPKSRTCFFRYQIDDCLLLQRKRTKFSGMIKKYYVQNHLRMKNSHKKPLLGLSYAESNRKSSRMRLHVKKGFRNYS